MSFDWSLAGAKIRKKIVSLKQIVKKKKRFTAYAIYSLPCTADGTAGAECALSLSGGTCGPLCPQWVAAVSELHIFDFKDTVPEDETEIY